MEKQTKNITAFYYRAATRKTSGQYSDNQMEKLLRYAGENVIDNFVLYIDNGVSGTTLDRPAFNALKAEVEAGHVQEIIVSDFSRIGRNFVSTCDFIKWTRTLGVDIISIADGNCSLTSEKADEIAKVLSGYSIAV
jgi:DNA invertase Pin-like site-specific DNA recombinase